MSVYRTRNGAIGNSIKNSISDILPNKNVESLERTKFQQSQVVYSLKSENLLLTYRNTF